MTYLSIIEWVLIQLCYREDNVVLRVTKHYSLCFLSDNNKLNFFFRTCNDIRIKIGYDNSGKLNHGTIDSVFKLTRIQFVQSPAHFNNSGVNSTTETLVRRESDHDALLNINAWFSHQVTLEIKNTSKRTTER